MKIILDVLRLQEPEPAHAYLKENLGFPDYYGHNLDALHDCLTEISQETEICLLTREEAGEENPLLRITEETAAESDFPYEEAYEDNAEDDSVTVSAEDESGPQE